MVLTLITIVACIFAFFAGRTVYFMYRDEHYKRMWFLIAVFTFMYVNYVILILGMES